MFELLDIVDAFSLPLKAAWIVWLAWGVAQFFWFRHECERSPLARSIPASRTAPWQRAIGPARPAVTRLMTADALTEMPSVTPDVPELNPSTDALQEFAASTELDEIVADFERHNGHDHNEDQEFTQSHARS